ncbi:MAG: Rpn family recombination-promoting nuclease/putative transposase [Caldilineaceae bacterium]
MSKPIEQADLLDPHDTFFRQMLSEPKTAIDFVANYLPAPVVELLDLAQLRIEKDTFVDARLRKHYSDVLYSVPLRPGVLPAAAPTVAPDAQAGKKSRGKRRKPQAEQDDGRVYLYLLFEHKSQPDGGVRLQLLRYMARIWEKEWKRRKLLSGILPIVFYHGQDKWHYTLAFADLVQAPAALRPYTPDFQHLLIDLSAYSNDEIRGEVWLRANLLLLKHIFDPDLIHKLPMILGLLVEIAQQESGLEMLHTLLIYISTASKHVSEDELFRVVNRVLPKGGATMEKTLAQQWIEKGIEKGIEQGIGKGQLIAQQRTLQQVLSHRFSLTTEQQEQFTHNFASIDNIDQLVHLVDQLLAAPTLADFEQAVLACLPPTKQRSGTASA